MVIESVDRHEAGIYICEAKNGVGHKSATASIKLQVLCKFCRSRFATTRHSGQNIMKSIQKVFIMAALLQPRGSIFQNEFLVGVQLIFWLNLGFWLGFYEIIFSVWGSIQ